jgi:hypothetical protein
VTGVQTCALPISLYKAPHSPPPWFTPNAWRKSEVHVLRERRDKTNWVHTQVLMYNDESGEAYFIEDLGDYGG